MPESIRKIALTEERAVMLPLARGRPPLGHEPADHLDCDRYLVWDKSLRGFHIAVTRSIRSYRVQWDLPARESIRRRQGMKARFAERLIGSMRRERVDHLIILDESHLRRILRTYARYYNKIRTHRSLAKDAPVSRPVQRTGTIGSHTILGGLHHHYVRV